MIILILVVIIPLVILLVFDNYYGMQLLRKQAALSNINLLSVYMAQLDDNLDYFTNYLKTSAEGDPDIYNYVNSTHDSPERIQAEGRIINKFCNQLNYQNDIHLFFLYSESDKNLLLASNDTEKYNKELLTTKIDGLIFVIETIGIEDWQLMEYKGTFKLVKIVNVSGDTYLGTWLGLEGLLEPLKGLDLGNNGGVYIVTEKGFPLISTYYSRKSMEILNHNEFIPGTGTYKTIKDMDSEEKFLVVADTLENLPIYFIAMLPEAEIFKNLLSFRKLIYFIPIVGLFFLLVYLILIKRILFTPMNKLITAMKQVSQGNLEVRLSEDSTQDFNFLFDSFNNMVNRVRRLKMNVYEEKILTQKAELRHLQAQIRPHFLYNSLNLIYNLAVLKDLDSIKQMSLYLASYLRFTLRNEDKLVTLEEELNHIKNYLEIQKIRFLDKFTYHISTDSGYKLIKIPPLTIQPFVENSIIHGFNKKIELFQIEISVNREKDILLITITDNGRGFSEESLRELTEKNFEGDDGKHIGIWNVYRRLSLKYGEKADLKFYNQDSGGAVVLIMIPVETDPSSTERREKGV